MSALRVGVIGCGMQGQNHLEAFAAFDDVEIAAIADLDRRRVEEVGERFAVERRCSDPRELLGLGLDLVSVCTMPNSHRELVVGAFEAGSHVLCEKPLARDAAEGAEMVRAAEHADRLLIVGFNMRYMGATTAVRRFMQDGSLGDLVCARGFMNADDVPWWGKHYVREVSGGGALNASAVHMVDLLLWLAGNPRPLTASASMATVFPRKRAHGAPPGAAEAYDTEDVLFGHVRCEGGFWFSLEGSWMNDRSGLDYSFDAIGTRGQAHLQPLELYSERDGAVVRLDEGVSTEPDWQASWAPQLHDAVEAVRTGRVPEQLATGRQALTVQALVDALYRSAREGREVAVAVPDV